MCRVQISSAVLLVLLALGGVAAATDQPISATRLQLRLLPSGKQRLVFKTKDRNFLFPASAADDPLTEGLVLELLSPAASASLTAPATGAVPGWSFKPGNYKFKRRATPATVTRIKSIVMRQGRNVAIAGDATGLAMTGPLGSVGVRIVTGSLRSCALFAAGSVITDVTGNFGGKNAPKPGSCSTPILSGVPPVCGDGEVNQSTEECDGSEVTACPTYPNADCVPAGAADECRCCSDSGTFVDCCNPSSIVVPTPPMGASCYATRCDPPFECPGGNQCQPDGACCTMLNAICRLVVPLPAELNACCPGMECSKPLTISLSSFMTCCVSDGGSCTTNDDCCSSNCQGDGTCGP